MNKNGASPLIIRNMSMIVDVLKYLTEEIQKDFFEAIDELVKDYMNDWIGGENKWDCITNFLEEEISFRPNKWRADESNKESLPAGYDIILMEDGKKINWHDDLWIPEFMGLSSSQVGFRMYVNYGVLNNNGHKQAVWKNFINGHRSFDQIRSAGFIALNDGNWFLPFKISTDTLAEAFENDVIKDALDPIKNALETIQKNHPLFETLVDDAIKQFGLKNS